MGVTDDLQRAAERVAAFPWQTQDPQAVRDLTALRAALAARSEPPKDRQTSPNFGEAEPRAEGLMVHLNDGSADDRAMAWSGGHTEGYREAYQQGFSDAVEAHKRRTATPPAEGLDGLAPLISTILRKYGGTMKGRGDHDIFDALVRYRVALAPEQPE